MTLELERERAVQALAATPAAYEPLPMYSVAPADSAPRERRFLALMGEVRIVLPPGLHADVDGLAVMGEFSDRTAGAASTLDAPVIRVKGMACLGAVRVETRMPNEGVLEAWKRRLRGA